MVIMCFFITEPIGIIIAGWNFWRICKCVCPEIEGFKAIFGHSCAEKGCKKKWASDWSIRFCITDLLEKLHKVEFRQWWNFSNPPAINMFIPFAHQSGPILITIYITMNMVGIQILNKSWLVVWNMNFIVPFSWECHHPNWRTHMFQRGRYTTNHCYYFYVGIIRINHWIIRILNKLGNDPQ